MRIGEANRLKWTDINSQNNTIILNDPRRTAIHVSLIDFRPG